MGSREEESWCEACEREARQGAATLARLTRRGAPDQELLAKYIESLSRHYEEELAKLREKVGNGVAGAAAQEENSDYFEQEPEPHHQRSPKFLHRPFFRRLSFKALKKGKGFFYRQVSDEAENSESKCAKFDKQSKTRLAKIVVECRKEGIVNYLIGENPDGTQKWEKCRLALVKTVGGYMLEFYSPPKSAKPKSGVFCFLIAEARETTALEMPDHENTFVLKADHNMEYVIEAHDIDDMRSWLATVKYCMRGSGGEGGGGGSEPKQEGEDPPELPPRLQEAGGSHPELCSSDAECEVDLSTTLQDYPWFHGTLPRSDAASLVLNTGANGHGVFLVRQSETRKGEFVLTFNFHSRAKHLRMTINDVGQCRVQHLWFATIFDMLEHFRQHPIPLESGGTADVTLTHYVVASVSSNSSQAGARGSSSSQGERRPPPTPEQRDVVLHGGSIRTRTESIERVHDSGSTASVSSAVVGGRAVENTYSFV
jgi:hypothetical protein